MILKEWALLSGSAYHSSR